MNMQLSLGSNTKVLCPLDAPYDFKIFSLSQMSYEFENILLAPRNKMTGFNVLPTIEKLIYNEVLSSLEMKLWQNIFSLFQRKKISFSFLILLKDSGITFAQRIARKLLKMQQSL